MSRIEFDVTENQKGHTYSRRISPIMYCSMNFLTDAVPSDELDSVVGPGIPGTLRKEFTI
jgi:hypothetical protein